MESTPTRRGSTVYAPPSTHCTAPAPEMQQVEDLPLAEQYLTGTQFASGGRAKSLRPLPGGTHTRQNSQAMMTDPFQQSSCVAVGHAPLPSSELRVSDKNISPGGISETVCPSNGLHSRRASQQGPSTFNHTQAGQMPSHLNHQVVPQGFPLIERPSTDSVVIGAFPNTLEPEEHGPCITMLQDAQAALEDLAMRVKVAEHDKSILIDKIKSLVDDVSRLRLQAAVSDTQALQDRIEGLVRQIGYLMTIPRNEEYLGKIKLFEAEARDFRQAKFEMEQIHAQKVLELENDKEVLMRKLKVTEHCYSTELRRVSDLLQRQREMTKKALQDYASVEAKSSKLEMELDQERSKVSELHMYFNQQQEWGQAANDAFSKNIRCMTSMLENFTESVRIENQHLGITDRALKGWLGNPADDPPPEPRRR
ncbi:hypothetical protein BKA80DRAFT_310303 [Phyllosticta citrichinensis]